MRIVIIGAFPEEVRFIKGGVQASVYGLAKTLHSLYSADVEIVSLPLRAASSLKRSENAVDGIRVTYLHAFRFLVTAIVHLPFILRRIHSTTDSIVHIHGTGLLQCVLLIWLRVTKTSTTWTLHGILAKETWQAYCKNKRIPALLRYGFYSIIERISLFVSQKVIVDTQYVADVIHRKKQLYVIPQGIFPEEFSSNDTGIRDANLVLSVGVISPRKGHHHLIEAFAKVKSVLPDARLVIAGALPVLDYHNTLLALIARLGLKDSVGFAIHIPRAEIIALLKKASVFALHSEEESQGIALCEALCAGLPVVATNAGGIPYVVSHDHDGFLVEYGDVAAFARYIGLLLSDPVLQKKMAHNAVVSARRFEWKNCVQRIIEVYNA